MVLGEGTLSGRSGIGSENRIMRERGVRGRVGRRVSGVGAIGELGGWEVVD